MIIAAAQEVELGISERKGRERVEREQRIVASARSIAEAEGWAAVTIRRLAEEVEYSQPVLYSHFENRDAIVAAVAVEAFNLVISDVNMPGMDGHQLLGLLRFGRKRIRLRAQRSGQAKKKGGPQRGPPFFQKQHQAQGSS